MCSLATRLSIPTATRPWSRACVQIQHRKNAYKYTRADLNRGGRIEESRVEVKTVCDSFIRVVSEQQFVVNVEAYKQNAYINGSK